MANVDRKEVINKKGKVVIYYRARVFLGFDENKKMIFQRKTFKVGKDIMSTTPTAQKKEAQKLADEWEAKLKHQRKKEVIRADKILISDVVVEWMNYLKQRAEIGNLAESSVYYYKRDYDRYCSKTFDHLTVEEVTDEVAQDYINSLRYKKKLSVSTTKQCLAAMRSLFNFIVKEKRILPSSPFKDVRIPRENRKKKKEKENNKKKHFDKEQATLFLNVLNAAYEYSADRKITVQIDGTEKEETIHFAPVKFKVKAKWVAFFSTLISCGLRPGEILALRWRCIDFNKKLITVEEAVSRDIDGKIIISETKTPLSERTFYLSHLAEDALLAWKNEQIEYAKNLGTAWKGLPVKQFGDQLIFTGIDGEKQVGEDTAVQMFHSIVDRWNKIVDTEIEKNEDPDFVEALKNQKLPRLTSYGLRHTFATLELDAGASPNVIARKMGHADLTMINQRYAHPLDEAAKKADSTFDKMIKSKKENYEPEELLKIQSLTNFITDKLPCLNIEELEKVKEAISQLSETVPAKTDSEAGTGSENGSDGKE